MPYMDGKGMVESENSQQNCQLELPWVMLLGCPRKLVNG